MAITVRPITEEEFETFHLKISHGFGFDPTESERPHYQAVLEIDRTVAAFDGKEMVGTGGAFSYQLTVPGGGTLPMGGTTIISVQPTHRRRGVLTAMMRGHLDEVRARNEPVAGLWASETPIYGRFGYGLATQSFQMKLDATKVEFTGSAPTGSVKLHDADEARPLVEELFDRVRPTRPGMLTRSDAWWTHRIVHDPEFRRKGYSSRRYAVYRGPDGPEGYAIYRQKAKWDEFPDGEVQVQEVIAVTPDAHHALWRYLCNIDLFPRVDYWNMPVDDELPWRVTDWRRVVSVISDAMWIRILDIPRTLTGRTYRHTGSMVLGIRDPFMPDNEGGYRLAAGPDGAECHRTDDPPDLELPIDALGAAYLGHRCLPALARTGVVHGTPAAVALADDLFSTESPPWTQEIF